MHYVESSATIEYTVKKSRFIGMIIPCQTENDVLQQLNSLQQEYINASHLVFAYRIKSEKGIITRFYDAGEPKGSAGKPVFQHLEGKDLINTLCVVIRYFGGIKLGAGGLTRAYSNTAQKTIESCSIKPYIEYSFIDVELAYKQLQDFEYQLKKLDGIITDQVFSEKINLVVKLPQQNISLLTEQFKPIINVTNNK